MRVILIIEDDAALREAMQTALELAGFTVHVARDGQLGLALQRRYRADMVVTDISMPVMDGFEVIAAMTREFPGIRIIAVSGRMTDAQKLDRLRAARQMGALWTLRKPFDDVALVDAVNTALAASGPPADDDLAQPMGVPGHRPSRGA
jgi:DNA-binding response OmpR family regulator